MRPSWWHSLSPTLIRPATLGCSTRFRQTSQCDSHQGLYTSEGRPLSLLSIRAGKSYRSGKGCSKPSAKTSSWHSCFLVQARRKGTEEVRRTDDTGLEWFVRSPLRWWWSVYKIPSVVHGVGNATTCVSCA